MLPVAAAGRSVTNLTIVLDREPARLVMLAARYHVSFFAGGVALLAIVVGIALLLVGVGFLVLISVAARRAAGAGATTAVPA